MFTFSQSKNCQSRRARRCGTQRFQRAARRSAFTLIEIMVALAIFLVMLAIIFVPLNLGLNLFSIGKTRSNVLLAAQSTLDDMEGELRKAIVVFPNAAMTGVTDRAPYVIPAVNPTGHPYVRVTASGYGVCDANDPTKAEYVDNTHRLDFLLPDTFDSTANTEGVQAVMPLRAAPYLVSYYYRRQDATMTAEPFNNPIMLYRAQMPYREYNNTIIYSGGGRNVNLLPFAQNGDPSRYPDPNDAATCTGAPGTNANRGSYWLKQLYVPADPLIGPLNEPNLEPLAFDSSGTPSVNGSHTAMLPKGIALVTRNAFTTAPDYTPDTTFQCADTNADGKIDQVTITLVIGSFDENSADRSNSLASDRAQDSATGGYSVNSQRIRQTRVVTLTNVR